MAFAGRGKPIIGHRKAAQVLSQPSVETRELRTVERAGRVIIRNGDLRTELRLSTVLFILHCFLSLTAEKQARDFSFFLRRNIPSQRKTPTTFTRLLLALKASLPATNSVKPTHNNHARQGKLAKPSLTSVTVRQKSSHISNSVTFLKSAHTQLCSACNPVKRRQLYDFRIVLCSLGASTETKSCALIVP